MLAYIAGLGCEMFSKCTLRSLQECTLCGVSAFAWKCVTLVRKANRPDLLENFITKGETLFLLVQDIEFQGRVRAALVAGPVPSGLEST